MDTTPPPGGHAPPTGARTVDLDGCVNFRDVGGYATAEGGRVRRGRLYRADGLSRLTDRDIDTLRALGIRTVVDLRTPSEADTRGSFPVDRLPVVFAALPLTDVLPAPEELPEWKEAGFVADRYVEMVEGGRDAIAGTISTVVAAGAMPAVVHCSAGKDRTGIVSALALWFAGVGEDDIAADYARSGPAMELLLARLRLEHPEAGDALDRYAPAVLHAAPETMTQFLAALGAAYGGPDGVSAHLGIAPEAARLRALLVEPA